MFVEQRYVPTTFTKPLSEQFCTDGPRLRKFVRLFGKTEDGKPLVLDDWQADLIDHVLERYPANHPNKKLAGRLRYRQVVISMGRQNGKSVLGAVLGMYGLMLHMGAPFVVSVASTVHQANIVFGRVKGIIDGHKSLATRFRTSKTRGISRKDKAGDYIVLAGKGDALQGYPITLGLYDEVHITPPELWSAMVLGTTAQQDGLVVGITTAGDDSSVLLKNLYKTGRAAAQGTGDLERFGFFLWEAPEGADVDDPEALKDANPALAEGRLDLDVIVEAVRTLPEHEARRYRLNQFVGSENAWMPASLWHRVQTDDPLPSGGPLVFSIDRTPNWEHATVWVTTKVDGTLHSAPVLHMSKPSTERLLEVCASLWKHSPQAYVMDGYTLGNLANELERRGYPTRVIRGGEVTNATSIGYSLIASQRVKVTSSNEINLQMPFAVSKAIGNAYRINRASSSVYIDAVIAMVYGMYVAETEKEASLGIY